MDKLSPSLSENLLELERRYGGTDDLLFREFTVPAAGGRKAVCAYLLASVDQTMVADQVIEPLIRAGETTAHVADLLSSVAVTTTSTWAEIVTALPGGSVLLLVEGMGEALLCPLRLNAFRAIAEPESSPVVRGAREGFIESLDVNLALVRRRIASPDLHVRFLSLGRLTQTKVAVLHIRGVAKQQVVEEVLARLGRIELDGVLESGYLEEYIQDRPFSIFPQVKNTERVDAVAGSLLEGRVAVLTDGTPFALIVPVSMSGILQVTEDYYQRWPLATFTRWVRFFATTLALTLTGAYVAVVSFNQEILPFGLALRLAASRSGLPFPALVEALILEGAFEILREAGLRMPRPIGQAVSIVGVLVLGEAAVRAGVVGPVMIIVVGAGALTSFAIPDYAMVSSFRVTRLLVILLSGTFGFFGLMWGVLFVVIHMLTLKSFGLPYLSPMAPFRPRALLRDAWSRHLWPLVMERPAHVSSRARRQPSPTLPSPQYSDPREGGRS